MVNWHRLGHQLGAPPSESGVSSFLGHSICLDDQELLLEDCKFERSGPRHRDVIVDTTETRYSSDLPIPANHIPVLCELLGCPARYFECDGSASQDSEDVSKWAQQGDIVPFLILLNKKHWTVLVLTQRCQLRIFSTTNLLLEFDLSQIREQFKQSCGALLSLVATCDIDSLFSTSQVVQVLQYGNQGCAIASVIVFAMHFRHDLGAVNWEEHIIQSTDAVRQELGTDAMFLCTVQDEEPLFPHVTVQNRCILDPFLSAPMMTLDRAPDELVPLLPQQPLSSVQLIDFGPHVEITAADGGPPIDRSLRIWPGWEFALRVFLHRKVSERSACFSSIS